MKKLATILGSLALAALPCASALASPLTFTFSGTDFSATGSFTVNPAGVSGKYVGTSTYGTATVFGTDVTITGIAPLMSFLGNDNLYFMGQASTDLNLGRPFDFQGFAFVLSNGDAINIFSDAGKDYEILGNNSTGAEIVTDTAAISVSGTPSSLAPEPGSLALLGTGALGAFGLLRRKLSV